jgi:hypothetical protein
MTMIAPMALDSSDGSSKALPVAEVILNLVSWMYTLEPEIGVGERVFLMEMSLFRESLNCDFVARLGRCCRFTAAAETRVAAPGLAADYHVPNHRFLIVALVTGT